MHGVFPGRTEVATGQNITLNKIRRGGCRGLRDGTVGYFFIKYAGQVAQNVLGPIFVSIFKI